MPNVLTASGTLTAAFFGIQAAGAGRSQAISALNENLRTQAAVDGATTPFKMDPSAGPHAGNTRVSISGNGLSAATQVNFGTSPGTNFEVVNDGLARVTSPAVPLDRDALQMGKSDVPVTVVLNGAPNRVVATFYYYTIEPSKDGKMLNIYGTGLTGATGVQFGSANPIPVRAEKDQQLQINKSEIPSEVFEKEVEVAIIYAPDTPTKRFVIGRYRYPPLPEPAPGS